MAADTHVRWSAAPYNLTSKILPIRKALPDSDICLAETADSGQISRISNTNGHLKILLNTKADIPVKSGGEVAQII
jgi:hypothetical protein